MNGLGDLVIFLETYGSVFWNVSKSDIYGALVWFLLLSHCLQLCVSGWFLPSRFVPFGPMGKFTWWVHRETVTNIATIYRVSLDIPMGSISRALSIRISHLLGLPWSISFVFSLSIIGFIRSLGLLARSPSHRYQLGIIRCPSFPLWFCFYMCLVRNRDNRFGEFPRPRPLGAIFFMFGWFGFG